MTTRYHETEDVGRQYRTVVCQTDGRYIVIAAWSTFDKALGCSFGFYAAEKKRYETTGMAENFSVFVQRLDPKGGCHDWTTVTKSILRLDFGSTQQGSTRRYKSGDTCEAVLLAQKTRNGGWIAKIPGTTYEGPITNTNDVPTSALSGETVKLKIGAIGRRGQHIQFTWFATS